MISVVVSTYNWPAFNLSLQSLFGQTDHNFEIVVADDGSRDDTRMLVDSFGRRGSVLVTHVWHKDEGFRKTTILNKAIAIARGTYVVFLDGDCIVQSDFVARHRAISETKHFVTGSRILLGRKLSEDLSAAGLWDQNAFLRKAAAYRLKGQISKIMPLFLRFSGELQHNYRKFVWRRIKGCNLACWKSDVDAVSGFNETITGWGHEDADFVFRLQENGVIRRSGVYATEILHLWHENADNSSAEKNKQAVIEQIAARRKARSQDV